MRTISSATLSLFLDFLSFLLSFGSSRCSSSSSGISSSSWKNTSPLSLSSICARSPVSTTHFAIAMVRSSL